MKKGFYLFCLLLSFSINAQNNCSVSKKSFQPNEQLTYEIFYNWGAIWMETGEVVFNTSLIDLNNTKVYHFSGNGFTYHKYD